MDVTHCFGHPADSRFNPNSPSVQTSFYQGTPSPADSGVMSPMTPLGSWTGSTPEHLTNGFQSSPYPVQPSLDEGHSPFPMTSPMSSNDEEKNYSSHNYRWQPQQSLDLVGKKSVLHSSNHLNWADTKRPIFVMLLPIFLVLDLT